MPKLSHSPPRRQQVPAYVQEIWDGLKGLGWPGLRIRYAKSFATLLRSLNKRLDAFWHCGEDREKEFWHLWHAENIGILAMMLTRSEQEQVNSLLTDVLQGDELLRALLRTIGTRYSRPSKLLDALEGACRDIRAAMTA